MALCCLYNSNDQQHIKNVSFFKILLVFNGDVKAERNGSSVTGSPVSLHFPGIFCALWLTK